MPLDSGVGYAQLTGGYATDTGAFARGEVGLRLAPNVGVFGWGEWTPRATSVGAGARVTF